MSRDLRFELRFQSDPARLLQKVRTKAQSAGAVVNVDPSGLTGTFRLKKLMMTLAEGQFEVVPDNGGQGGVAKIHITQAPPFVGDDRIRSVVEGVFSEVEPD